MKKSDGTVHVPNPSASLFSEAIVEGPDILATYLYLRSRSQSPCFARSREFG